MLGGPLWKRISSSKPPRQTPSLEWVIRFLPTRPRAAKFASPYRKAGQAELSSRRSMLDGIARQGHPVAEGLLLEPGLAFPHIGHALGEARPIKLECG